MKQKYFFFDIDGTLTCSKGFNSIPESTLCALQELQRNGHFVAIATGRPYYFACDLAQAANLDNLVCNGGNDIYLQGNCIVHQPLDRRFAQQVIEDCLAYKIPFCVSYDNSIKRITHNDAFQHAVKDFPFRGDLFIDATLDYAQLPAIERLFVAIPEGEERTLPCFQQYQPCRYGKKPYVIVEPDDKYSGIEKMVTLLRGNLEDVVVFGDGVNDVKMFQQAPFAIAMGNAVVEIKNLADFITKSNDEDGIAYALRHFGWIG